MSAKHTPYSSEWPELAPDAVYTQGLTRIQETQNKWRTRLMQAAAATYWNHCGPRAVECAEEDLLGRCLAALEDIRREKFLHGQVVDSMREVHEILESVGRAP